MSSLRAVLITSDEALNPTLGTLKSDQTEFGSHVTFETVVWRAHPCNCEIYDSL